MKTKVGIIKSTPIKIFSTEIKPVHPKGNKLEYSLEGPMLKLKLQYSGHLMWTANSLEKTLILGKTEGRRRRGWQRMRWLDSTINSIDVSLSTTLGDGEEQGSLAGCGPQGHKGSDVTEQLNNNEWRPSTLFFQWRLPVCGFQVLVNHRPCSSGSWSLEF